MEQKVLQALHTQGLVTQGQRVTVALSGGADSMALLTVLLRLKDTLGITVYAAHFNHGLRGEEAKRDEDFVRQWCKECGVALTVGHGDVQTRVRETGESPEEAARVLRYAFFDRLDTDTVATAHTANDNAETLLLHLLRGTGPRGLCGIPARRGRYIRPLLSVTREEIGQYLSEQGIPHIEDSSNALDDCVRNRLRHRVMPELLRENPRFLEAAERAAALQSQEDAFLSGLADSAEQSCRLGDGHDCKKLRALHPVLLRRVLMRVLCKYRVENPSARHIEALEHLVQTEHPSSAIRLPGGLTAQREYDLLRVSECEELTFAPVTVPIPGRAVLPEAGLEVSCFVTENSQSVQKKANTICLKYDMIAETVTLRPRKVGDALHLRGGTKTVKKLMIDRKIPAAKRSLTPVIELCGTVAAVAFAGTDTAFLPMPGQPVLVMEFQKRGKAYDTDGTASGY